MKRQSWLRPPSFNRNSLPLHHHHHHPQTPLNFICGQQRARVWSSACVWVCGRSYRSKREVKVKVAAVVAWLCMWLLGFLSTCVWRKQGRWRLDVLPFFPSLYFLEEINFCKYQVYCFFHLKCVCVAPSRLSPHSSLTRRYFFLPLIWIIETFIMLSRFIPNIILQKVFSF